MNIRRAIPHFSTLSWFFVPFGNILAPAACLFFERLGNNKNISEIIAAVRFQFWTYLAMFAAYCLTGMIFGSLLVAAIGVFGSAWAISNGIRVARGRGIKYPFPDWSSTRLLFGLSSIAGLVAITVALGFLATNGGSLTTRVSELPPPTRNWGADGAPYPGIIEFSDRPWLECADIAVFVYNDLSGNPGKPFPKYPTGFKWAPIYVASNERSGFYAAAFRYDDGTIAIAFRGTNDWRDGLVDVLMGFGVRHQQFRDADAFYAEVLARFKKDKVIVVGHSLGGSLAQYIASKHRTMAVTFDPFGVAALVNESVPAPVVNKIVNFAMDYDPISSLQFPYTLRGLINSVSDFLTGAASNHVGCMIRWSGVQQGWNFWRLFEWHSVETVRDRIIFYETFAFPGEGFDGCIRQPPRWKKLLREIGILRD